MIYFLNMCYDVCYNLTKITLNIHLCMGGSSTCKDVSLSSQTLNVHFVTIIRLSPTTRKPKHNTHSIIWVTHPKLNVSDSKRTKYSTTSPPTPRHCRPSRPSPQALQTRQPVLQGHAPFLRHAATTPPPPYVVYSCATPPSPRVSSMAPASQHHQLQPTPPLASSRFVGLRRSAAIPVCSCVVQLSTWSSCCGPSYAGFRPMRECLFWLSLSI
jgi:hypothetical protein